MKLMKNYHQSLTKRSLMLQMKSPLVSLTTWLGNNQLITKPDFLKNVRL